MEGRAESAAGEGREPAILLAVGMGLLALSGAWPRDRFTWLLEVSPILVALPLLVATYGRFRLSPLVYRLLFLQAGILMLGAHYTYEHTPLGYWMQAALGFSRNPYDRVGHLAQGFVPALLVREVLLRRTPLRPGPWLFFLVTCVCLAASAFWEFLEWWAAVAMGERAEAFLATQGDPWDTQWDMFMAFLGAVLAQLTLGRAHDRQLVRLT